MLPPKLRLPAVERRVELAGVGRRVLTAALLAMLFTPMDREEEEAGGNEY